MTELQKVVAAAIAANPVGVRVLTALRLAPGGLASLLLLQILLELTLKLLEEKGTSLQQAELEDAISALVSQK